MCQAQVPNRSFLLCLRAKLDVHGTSSLPEQQELNEGFINLIIDCSEYVPISIMNFPNDSMFKSGSCQEHDAAIVSWSPSDSRLPNTNLTVPYL